MTCGYFARICSVLLVGWGRCALMTRVTHMVKDGSDKKDVFQGAAVRHFEKNHSDELTNPLSAGWLSRSVRGRDDPRHDAAGLHDRRRAGARAAVGPSAEPLLGHCAGRDARAQCRDGHASGTPQKGKAQPCCLELIELLTQR
jgi:hypothetical protein